jgi:DNA-binding PadR family transcriptional regulator
MVCFGWENSSSSLTARCQPSSLPASFYLWFEFICAASTSILGSVHRIPSGDRRVPFHLIASTKSWTYDGRFPLDGTCITPYDTTRDVISMSDPTLLILASLADGDKHGYAMMEDIHRFANLRLGPGTLYGAITRLEACGWIRPIQSGDRRQPYRITPAGRHYLEEELASLDQIVRTGLRRLREA